MTPPDRTGAPAPLIRHLVSAARILEQGASLAPLAASERFPWGSAPDAPTRKLAAAVAGAPAADMATALRAEGARRLSAMMRGLRRYQQSDEVRSLADPPAIWRRGAARLLDYGPSNGRPVLIAPSLVNRFHVLDLDRGCSLIRHLSSSGLRPLLLDWGAPAAEERDFDLEAYVLHRLEPALDAACDAAGVDGVAVAGYCMGGVLAAALAARRPAAVARLGLVGAPWDNAHMTPMRSALAAAGVPGDRAALAGRAATLRATLGAVPPSLMQSVFAELDPGLALRKFRRFAALPEGAPAARRFVLLEDWLNAGPPLAAPAARAALVDWHLDNLTAREAWRVGGAPVTPQRIAAPLLVAAATEDRIAPPAAVTAIAAGAPDVRVIEPKAGHVGMIVGRDAMAQLWRPLADFLLS